MFTEKDMIYLLNKGNVKINKNSVTKNLSKETLNPPKRNKYRNRKVAVDGIVFDSMLEAKRYQSLKLLEKAGAIRKLELQRPFLLQPGFISDGKSIRPIKYVADFVYVDADGRTVVEDTKGCKTKEYQLKKKMLLYKYPDITFREIRKDPDF